jgi:hypothetical protein
MDLRFKSTFDKLFRPIARQPAQAEDQAPDLRKAHPARNEELSAIFKKFDCTIADIEARLDRIEARQIDGIFNMTNPQPRNPAPLPVTVPPRAPVAPPPVTPFPYLPVKPTPYQPRPSFPTAPPSRPSPNVRPLT